MVDWSNDGLLNRYFTELIKELIFCKAVLVIRLDLKISQSDMSKI